MNKPAKSSSLTYKTFSTSFFIAFKKDISITLPLHYIAITYAITHAIGYAITCAITSLSPLKFYFAKAIRRN